MLKLSEKPHPYVGKVENAIKVIKSCHGFDDESTTVGEAFATVLKRIKELEDGRNKRFREMEEALAAIYESRATHCQGCKEHGQIAKAALTGE